MRACHLTNTSVTNTSVTNTRVKGTTMKTLRELFSDRDHATGMWLTLGSPSVAELIVFCEFDWLVIDMEHSANTTAALIDQVRAIESAAHRSNRTVTPIARVRVNEHVEVKQAMDAGCSALIFPDIRTATETEAAVAAMQYPVPGGTGTRGVAGLVRAGHYGTDPTYVARSNDEACAIVQIESKEAVENLEEIAAVPGVGCLFIGPADLSASLGHLGDDHHPEVLAAIDKIIDVAAAAGIPTGVFASNAQEADVFAKRGVFMVGLHSDVEWLARGIRDMRSDLSFTS